MNQDQAVRISDAINSQQLGNVQFVSDVWMREPNTLAIIDDTTTEIMDLIQAENPRTLYYAIRQTLRRRNRKPITIERLAIYRGLKRDTEGNYSCADIAAVGLQLIGGCEICHASIAAYNAYPCTSGWWRCEDCIGNRGYMSLQQANLAIFGKAATR